MRKEDAKVPRTRKALLLALPVLFTTLLWAQGEAAFTVGGSLPTHVNNNATPSFSESVGGTAFVEGEFASRLTDLKAMALYVEFPVIYVTTRTPQFSSLYVTPSAKLSFLTKQTLSPFASVGGGLARYGQTADNGNAITNLTYAIQFGGGVDVNASRRIAFRAELRDFLTGAKFLVGAGTNGSRFNNVLVGGGIVFRF